MAPIIARDTTYRLPGVGTLMMVGDDNTSLVETYLPLKYRVRNAAISGIFVYGLGALLGLKTVGKWGGALAAVAEFIR